MGGHPAALVTTNVSHVINNETQVGAGKHFFQISLRLFPRPTASGLRALRSPLVQSNREALMFCRECGKEMPDDATFCPECGHAVQATGNNKGMKPRGALKFVPLAVIAVVGVAFAANALVPKPSASTSSDSKETAATTQPAIEEEAVEQTVLSTANTKFFSANQDLNYQNDGSFAYDKEHIYTVDYDVDNQVSTIYSSDYQGNNKTAVLTGKWIESIRVVGDKIFYRSRVDINPSLSEYPIGCVNKDGTGDQVIITLSMSLAPNSWFDVEGDSLYYLLDGNLRSCSLTGENDTLVVETGEVYIGNFIIDEGVVYYVDFGSASGQPICSYNLATGEKDELCRIKGDGHLAIEGDTLYFSDSEGLKSISLSGSREMTTVVDDDKLSDYVLYDDCVFYRHTLSDDEKESAAKSKAGTAAEVPEDKIKKIQGYLYKAQLGGGAKGRPAESDQSFLGELFACPTGLYRRFLTYSFDSIALK